MPGTGPGTTPRSAVGTGARLGAQPMRAPRRFWGAVALPEPRERSRWLVLQVRGGRELHSRAARFPSLGLSLRAGSSEAGLCSAEPPPVCADRPCVISTNHQVPASTQAHSRAFVRAVSHEVSPCHRSVAVNTAQAPNNAHVTLVRRCLNIRLRYPGQCRSRRGTRRDSVDRHGALALLRGTAVQPTDVTHLPPGGPSGRCGLPCVT